MALEIHLEPDREVTELPAPGARAALARADRAAIVLFPAIADSASRLRLAAEAGLRPVRERVFRGSVDLHVVVFERP
jgi:hypothetical protein